MKTKHVVTALAVMVLGSSSVMAVPIIRGTGNGALIGNDLTDLGNNGVEAAYVNGPSVPPAVLAGFDARFFSSSEPNFEGAEGAFNVFDNLTGGGNNKWCCEPVSEPTDGSGLFVGADFSQTLAQGATFIVLNRFTMTTSNDSEGRDPDVWAIQGSLDGSIWLNIFSTSTNVFGLTRNQVFEFSVANGDFATPAPFKQFRLFVDSTNGAGFFALGELELFGSQVTTPEPATATLGLLGVAGLMMRRRREV